MRFIVLCCITLTFFVNFVCKFYACTHLHAYMSTSQSKFHIEYGFYRLCKNVCSNCIVEIFLLFALWFYFKRNFNTYNLMDALSLILKCTMIRLKKWQCKVKTTPIVCISLPLFAIFMQFINLFFVFEYYKLFLWNYLIFMSKFYQLKSKYSSEEKKTLTQQNHQIQIECIRREEEEENKIKRQFTSKRLDMGDLSE